MQENKKMFLQVKMKAQREQSVILCGTLWYWIVVFALYGPYVSSYGLVVAFYGHRHVWSFMALALYGLLWSFMAEYRLFSRSFGLVLCVLDLEFSWGYKFSRFAATSSDISNQNHKTRHSSHSQGTLQKLVYTLALALESKF